MPGGAARREERSSSWDRGQWTGDRRQETVDRGQETGESTVEAFLYVAAFWMAVSELGFLISREFDQTGIVLLVGLDLNSGQTQLLAVHPLIRL